MSTKNVKAGLSKANVNAIAGAIGTATLNRLIPIFSTSVAYTKGQYTNYNNQLYRFTADKAAGAWDSSKVESASLNDLIHDVNEAVNTINNKANVDGNYPSMTVGLADNLNSKIMQNDVDAYNFRTAGGSKEIGNKCKENAIVGGSLGFNQLVNNGDFSNGTTGWSQGEGTTISAANNELSITITSIGAQYYTNRIQRTIPKIPFGHKVLLFADVKSPKVGTMNLCFRQDTTFKYVTVGAFQTVANEWVKVRKCLLLNQENTDYVNNVALCLNAISSGALEVNDVVQVKNIQCIDLTAMLGSTIANYVYALEQANAGAGVAWFRRYWKKPYYPYTPIGGFQHVITRGKKIVDFNQFDKNATGVTDNVGMGNSGGTYSSPGNFVTGYIKVLPNTVYYADSSCWLSWINWYDADKNFIEQRSSSSASPSNAVYGRWTGILSKKDVACINIKYDGERDGEFEEYKSSIEQCDAVSLYGIFDIDEDGNLIANGNRYNYDGSIDENYGLQTYASSSVSLASSKTNVAYYQLNKPNGSKGKGTRYSYGRLSKFGEINEVYNDSGIGASGWDDAKCVGRVFSGYFFDQLVIGFAPNTTLEQAQAFVDGMEFVYEKSTPTESSATSFAQVQDAYNWGTEEYLDPENDTRPCEVPVGHDTDYPLDCKSKLEIMPDLPTTDGVYACKVTSGTAEYTSLASWLNDNDYNKTTDLSSSCLTDSAGLTYSIKKASKTGNIVNLLIRANNGTGSSISAGSILFTLASGLYRSEQIKFVGVNDTENAVFNISSAGQVTCNSNIASGSTIHIVVTFTLG